MDLINSYTDYFWIFLYLLILIGMVVGLIMGMGAINRRRNQKLHEYNLTFLHVKVAKENEIEIKAAEHLFSSLSGLKKGFFSSLFTGQYRISFEIVSKIDGIGFYVVVPDEIASFVEKQINAVYQDAEIDIVNPSEIWDRGKVTKVAELKFRNLPFYPIKMYEEIKTDSLSLITSSMSKLGPDEVVAVQYVIQPAGDTWRTAGRSYVSHVKQKSSNPEKNYNIDTSFLEHVEKKIAQPGFDVAIRIIAISDDANSANLHINNVANAFEQFTDVNNNKFTIQKQNLFRPFFAKKLVDKFIFRELGLRDITIPILGVILYRNLPLLNIVELATIFHMPNKNVQTPNIMWLQSRKSSAPTHLPSSTDGIWIGESSFRGVKTQVHMKEKDRTRHFYIIGQTGTGKSELLKYMALEDIKNGDGVALIDPHGTDVQDLLTKIPENRIKDVIYFNVSDLDRPMGLNLLEHNSEEEQHMIINSFIALLYKLYDPNRQGIMGPILERTIRNIMLTAMTDPEATIVDVLRLLIDDNYAKVFIDRTTDPLVRDYWVEVAKTPANKKGENMQYFTSKFDKFVTDKLMRNILGQPKSSFNFPDVMKEKKILLVDLAKGKIGEENSNFIGLLIVPKILGSALARHKLLEQGIDFPNFYLYVDEFQNFATPDFETILSEARKYKLNLIVAHQFIQQLDEKIKNAIFGNVGSMCTFRVGADDAKFLEQYFGPTFTQQDISNLPVGNAYVRLLVDGFPTPPFSMGVPWDVISTKVPKSIEIANKIREFSRMTYGKPKAEVDEFINRRSGFYDRKPEPEAPDPSKLFSGRKIPF